MAERSPALEGVSISVGALLRARAERESEAPCGSERLITMTESPAEGPCVRGVMEGTSRVGAVMEALVQSQCSPLRRVRPGAATVRRLES